MKINLPEKVSYIIDILYSNGFEAYAVGGCVRDSYLNKEPKDWDITTSASPIDVKRIFDRTIDTGIEHGTVTVMLGNEGFEVTTYRIDGEYEDSRHPKQVIFTSNLIEDLKRRDFTINAMAYNDKVGLVDCFDGKGDLDKGIIRCVGEANERFNEDALRILRAVRFSAQLGFEIDKSTVTAIKAKAKNLINISAERIKVELDKILLSSNPNRLIKAYEYGITRVVLPEFDVMMVTDQDNPNHIYSVGVHTIKALENYDIINRIEKIEDESNIMYGINLTQRENLMLKWTILLHDVAKPCTKTYDEHGVAHFKMHESVGAKMAKVVFTRLKFDNYTSDMATRIIRCHDYRFTNSQSAVRRAFSKIGADIAEYLFIVKESDILAQNPDTFEEKISSLNESKRIYYKIRKEKECMSIKELDINGNDIIALGVNGGPKVGIILSDLLNRVLDNPELNNNKTLLDIVNKEYVNIS